MAVSDHKTLTAGFIFTASSSAIKDLGIAGREHFPQLEIALLTSAWLSRGE